VQLQITAPRKRTVLVCEDENIVAKHNQQITNFLSVTVALVAKNRRVAPQRKERTGAKALQVTLFIREASPFLDRMGHRIQFTLYQKSPQRDWDRRGFPVA